MTDPLIPPPAADEPGDVRVDDDLPADPPDLSGHHVVAVLVSHDGAAWLPRTLAALAALDRPLAHVVAVDTGSTDHSHALLEVARADAGTVDTVLSLPRGTGFAAAVDAGAQAAPARPVGTDATHDWVWLLHDDSAPEPGALTSLLTAADAQPSVAVLGPKVLGWDDPRRLLEVGVSISASGRRDTGLERHEQDQGQHDGQRDVLAVGSAGALVRRDVWDALGGLDRRLPLFRDDVDLGWRANAAGHRVVVVTDAVVHHAEASARGRREPDAGRAHRVDRTSALYVLLVNAGSLWLPFTWLRLAVLQLLRALAYLLGKAAAEATDELAAASSVLLRPGQVLDGRRARRGARAVPRRQLRPLFPPRGHQLRLAAEWLGGLLTTGTAAASGPGAVESGPADEDSESLGGGASGVWRRRLLRPAVVLVAGLTAVSLLAWRGLYRGGPLHGGALLPAPEGASDLWQSYLASWHPVGPGSGAAAPPSSVALAGWAALLLGDAGWAVTTLLVLAVPAAGLVGWLALRSLGVSGRLRVFGALVYALSPTLLSAVAQGRLGTVVAALLLPLVALAAARTAGLSGSPGSMRSAAVGALLLTVVIGFAPALWLPVVLLAVLAAALAVRERAARLRLLAVVLLPAVLLAPWSLGWIDDPTQLVLEAGLPLAASDDPPWTVLLLDPGGPVAVPLLLSLGLVLAGLAAFVRAPSSVAVRLGLATAGVGLVWALVLATLTVTPASRTVPVVPWPGPALVLATAGLVVAVVAAARSSRGRLATRALSWRQPALVVLTGLAVLVPVGSGVWWLGRGAADPLVRSDPDPLPAFVRAQAAEPERIRTLVLLPEGGRLGYTLLRDRPAMLGDEALAPAAASNAALDDLVGEIASGRGGVAVDELLAYAVQYILVSPPVDPRLEATLDSVPGLVRVSNPGDASLWRLQLPTGRLQLAADDPEAPPLLLPSDAVGADTPVPAGAGERRLLVAEAADAGWRATLDGRPLPGRSVDGWAQGFAVPASGGTLELAHRSPARTAWLVVEGLLVLAVLVAALPARRRDEEVVV